MAKLPFTKLNLKINEEVKTIEFNEQTIEIKQYLSVDEKLKIIEKVLNNSADDNNFANPVKVFVYTAIEIINYYTNITFTEKQRENVNKLYDVIISSGLYEAIYTNIPRDEYNDLLGDIKDTIDAYYKYKNSVFGILDTISTDYSNLNLDATNIQQKLADPDNMALLKNILTKLG